MATVAGADPWTAVRVGLSMTALQASIGALNDLVDVPSDRDRKPGKPIPAGLVSRRLAWAIVVTAACLGLGLALPGGGGLVALALLGLAVGYGYDLLAKGSAWSWVPFAIGIPLLPVYGWYGAVSGLASWFAALLPMAVLAGAALAVSNAHADLERDRDAGTKSVATVLGPERSWWATLVLWTVTAAIAIGSAATAGASPFELMATVAGVSVILAGTAIGRAAGPARRERAWELQAVGAAVTALGWIIAVA